MESRIWIAASALAATASIAGAAPVTLAALSGAGEALVHPALWPGLILGSGLVGAMLRANARRMHASRALLRVG